MPLNYTKRTWVNGAAPALSAANLQAVDDGVKAVSDWADTLLASTGVPNSAKAVKALGADIAALLTAAGYSLAPATGTANLDNIADGTTYKRILAAVATALNASTIVAGTQWGSGNDGNGGRPPAPKPSAYASGATSHAISNANRMLKLTPGDFTLPATGTFTYISVKWDSVTGIFSGMSSESGKAGGLVMDTTIGNQYCAAFVWRTA